MLVRKATALAETIKTRTHLKLCHFSLWCVGLGQMFDFKVSNQKLVASFCALIRHANIAIVKCRRIDWRFKFALCKY